MEPAHSTASQTIWVVLRSFKWDAYRDPDFGVEGAFTSQDAAEAKVRELQLAEDDSDTKFWVECVDVTA